MSDLVNLAADNNARWCDLVCRASGISTVWRPGFWVSRQASPQRYPEAVTLERAIPADKVISELPPARCSIKDSFADLDMDPHNFQPLFEATWVSRVPPADAKPEPGWMTVSAPGEVAEWLQASGSADLLPAEVVRDPSVRMVQLERAGRVIAGGILNRTGSVVGLSNVFSSDATVDPWEGLTAICSDLFPDGRIVGYERDEDLEAAITSGFEPLGPLTIWCEGARSSKKTSRRPSEP